MILWEVYHTYLHTSREMSWPLFQLFKSSIKGLYLHTPRTHFILGLFSLIATPSLQVLRPALALSQSTLGSFVILWAIF